MSISPTSRTLSAVTSTRVTWSGGSVGRSTHARQSASSSENLASSLHSPRTNAADRAVPTCSNPDRSSTRADAILRGSMVAAMRWTRLRRNNHSTIAETASDRVSPALMLGCQRVPDRGEVGVIVEPHGEITDDARAVVERELRPVSGGRAAERLHRVGHLVGEVPCVGERPVLKPGDGFDIAVASELGDVGARQNSDRQSLCLEPELAPPGHRSIQAGRRRDRGDGLTHTLTA